MYQHKYCAYAIEIREIAPEHPRNCTISAEPALLTLIRSILHRARLSLSRAAPKSSPAAVALFLSNFGHAGWPVSPRVRFANIVPSILRGCL
ncbi:hypothetical protein EVAR_67206_1 [Eumeta japonica]|uniref:Uncharacterized protein n=1 Tax=Eumeta variegata TaxID=151549 RepID=A0A4C2A3I3_EUMVA|nr:hypothetical protein EVAR_67206_1 [Eumeta japonica]